MASTPPDTFDIVIWARKAEDQPWQGGCLARFKAPEGGGKLRFELPGTVETLADSASLRPFAASPFSPGLWCLFFSDSSRFRCLTVAGQQGEPEVDQLRLERSGTGRANFQALLADSSGKVSLQPLKALLPLVPDTPASTAPDGARHRLVAVFTSWVTDAQGRRSELPKFATPVWSDADRAFLTFPPGMLTETGRLRLLTILVSDEAERFNRQAHEPKEDEPFRVMNALLAYAEKAESNPFDLDSAGSELDDANMMVIGISQPLTIE